MENNLIVSNNLNQLQNKSLKKELVTILKAMENISKSTWTYAKAMHTIVEDELYIDDYKNIKEFAEKCVKVAPSTMTKYTNAVKGMKELEKFGYTENDFTVSKANILYTLGENMKAYVEYAKANNFRIDLMSEKEMVNNIKKYLNGNDEAIENGSSENASSEEKEEIIIEIKLDGKIYQIPEKVLQKYEVKEEE